MNARDFLDLALQLVQGPAESHWRSAVSRAYYAAFHVARQLLRQCGFTVPHSERAHAFLWLRLSNSGHSSTVAAGSKLNALHGERNRADYDIHLTIQQFVARAEVQIAADIIQALDDALLEPTKTQITDAIKLYERDVLKQVTWHP